MNIDEKENGKEKNKHVLNANHNAWKMMSYVWAFLGHRAFKIKSVNEKQTNKQRKKCNKTSNSSSKNYEDGFEVPSHKEEKQLYSLL